MSILVLSILFVDSKSGGDVVGLLSSFLASDLLVDSGDLRSLHCQSDTLRICPLVGLLTNQLSTQLDIPTTVNKPQPSTNQSTYLLVDRGYLWLLLDEPQFHRVICLCVFILIVELGEGYYTIEIKNGIGAR